MEEGAKKLVKSKSGLRMVSVDKDASNPLYICEPKWTPDKDCKSCMECQAKFDFITRRHHCRRCGRCLCDGCCAQKLALPRMRFVDPERQCGRCALVTKEENDFFERHLKILTTGAIVSFNVCGDDRQDLSGPLEVFCRLSNDHSRLDFTSSTPVHSPETIGLSEILSFRMLPAKGTSGRDVEGNIVPTGVIISHRNSCNELRSSSLSVSNGLESKSKVSQVFVFALWKMLRIIESALQGNESGHKFEELKD